MQKRFSQERVRKQLAKAFGIDVAFDFKRIAKRQYIIFINQAPTGFNPEFIVDQLKTEFRDHSFSVIKLGSH